MMTDLAQLNSIKGLCWCVFVYYNIGKVNECLKGISLRIIFRNFFFWDGLEIFYGKMIKQLIFLTIFYIFYESDV